MRPKRKIWYEVTCFGSTVCMMHDRARKRWVNTRVDYENKKGQSSHKRCMTKQAAVREFYKLFNIPGVKDIVVLTLKYKNGQRLIKEDWYNSRSQELAKQ